MCGIGGAINSKLNRDELDRVLTGMQSDLRHRGPDDQATFISASGSAGLVSTRLAILDLSEAGHQPMLSDDGRYIIVLNGEIYNFNALREELSRDGEIFQSNS